MNRAQREALAGLAVMLVSGAWSLGCQPKAGATGPGARPVTHPIVKRPTGPMTAEQASKYVLELVNRDRAEEGLAAVEWDDTAAKAAREHVKDMTERGYAGHWGTDGSVPEERYTRAGGRHHVQENAACFFDATDRELDSAPTFLAEDLEAIEAVFMAEKPPHDGHRKNILTGRHNRLGVAVAKPKGIRQPCMAQEFVDEYGDPGDLPKTAKAGKVITVQGEVTAPAKFGGVGISRIDPSAPLAAKELLTRHTYPVPEPYVMYFPPGFVTPVPVKVNGNHYTIDVPLSDKGRAGRYGVSVWATFPPSEELVMVSLRTVTVSGTR